jgi:hypothetical protein
VVNAVCGKVKGEKKAKKKVKKEEEVSAKYDAGRRPGEKKDVKVRKYRNEISNNLTAVLWIRIGSVFNPYSMGSLDPDPDSDLRRQKPRKIENSSKISSYEVLGMDPDSINLDPQHFLKVFADEK